MTKRRKTTDEIIRQDVRDNMPRMRSHSSEWLRNRIEMLEPKIEEDNPLISERVEYEACVSVMFERARKKDDGPGS